MPVISQFLGIIITWEAGRNEEPFTGIKGLD